MRREHAREQHGSTQGAKSDNAHPSGPRQSWSRDRIAWNEEERDNARRDGDSQERPRDRAGAALRGTHYEDTHEQHDSTQGPGRDTAHTSGTRQPRSSDRTGHPKQRRHPRRNHSQDSATSASSSLDSGARTRGRDRSPQWDKPTAKAPGSDRDTGASPSKSSRDTNRDGKSDSVASGKNARGERSTQPSHDSEESYARNSGGRYREPTEQVDRIGESESDKARHHRTSREGSRDRTSDFGRNKYDGWRSDDARRDERTVQPDAQRPRGRPSLFSDTLPAGGGSRERDSEGHRAQRPWHDRTDGGGSAAAIITPHNSSMPRGGDKCAQGSKNHRAHHPWQDGYYSPAGAAGHRERMQHARGAYGSANEGRGAPHGDDRRRPPVSESAHDDPLQHSGGAAGGKSKSRRGKRGGGTANFAAQAKAPGGPGNKDGSKLLRFAASIGLAGNDGAHRGEAASRNPLKGFHAAGDPDPLRAVLKNTSTDDPKRLYDEDAARVLHTIEVLLKMYGPSGTTSQALRTALRDENGSDRFHTVNEAAVEQLRLSSVWQWLMPCDEGGVFSAIRETLTGNAYATQQTDVTQAIKDSCGNRFYSENIDLLEALSCALIPLVTATARPNRQSAERPPADTKSERPTRPDKRPATEQSTTEASQRTPNYWSSTGANSEGHADGGSTAETAILVHTRGGEEDQGTEAPGEKRRSKASARSDKAAKVNTGGGIPRGRSAAGAPETTMDAATSARDGLQPNERGGGSGTRHPAEERTGDTSPMYSAAAHPQADAEYDSAPHSNDGEGDAPAGANPAASVYKAIRDAPETQRIETRGGTAGVMRLIAVSLAVRQVTTQEALAMELNRALDPDSDDRSVPEGSPEFRDIMHVHNAVLDRRGSLSTPPLAQPGSAAGKGAPHATEHSALQTETSRPDEHAAQRTAELTQKGKGTDAALRRAAVACDNAIQAYEIHGSFPPDDPIAIAAANVQQCRGAIERHKQTSGQTDLAQRSSSAAAKLEDLLQQRDDNSDATPMETEAQADALQQAIRREATARRLLREAHEQAEQVNRRLSKMRKAVIATETQLRAAALRGCSEADWLEMVAQLGGEDTTHRLLYGGAHNAGLPTICSTDTVSKRTSENIKGALQAPTGPENMDAILEDAKATRQESIRTMCAGLLQNVTRDIVSAEAEAHEAAAALRDAQFHITQANFPEPTPSLRAIYSGDEDHDGGRGAKRAQPLQLELAKRPCTQEGGTSDGSTAQARKPLTRPRGSGGDDNDAASITSLPKRSRLQEEQVQGAATSDDSAQGGANERTENQTLPDIEIDEVPGEPEQDEQGSHTACTNNDEHPQGSMQAEASGPALLDGLTIEDIEQWEDVPTGEIASGNAEQGGARAESGEIPEGPAGAPESHIAAEEGEDGLEDMEQVAELTITYPSQAISMCLLVIEAGRCAALAIVTGATLMNAAEERRAQLRTECDSRQTAQQNANMRMILAIKQCDKPPEEKKEITRLARALRDAAKLKYIAEVASENDPAQYNLRAGQCATATRELRTMLAEGGPLPDGGNPDRITEELSLEAKSYNEIYQRAIQQTSSTDQQLEMTDDRAKPQLHKDAECARRVPTDKLLVYLRGDNVNRRMMSLNGGGCHALSRFVQTGVAPKSQTRGSTEAESA